MEKETIKKEEVKEEKSKKGLIITLIIICAVLLTCVGVCLLLLLRSGNKPKPVIDGTSITITFDSDGGLEVDKLTFKKGTEVELPTSTKDGFEFGGWFNGETEFKKEDTPKLEKDILLKAKWNELTSEESLMTINFDSKGGNKVSSIQVKCINNSTEITNLPTPKREGYNFMSWADKNGTPILNGANLICDEKLDLYANWEKKDDNKKTAKCPNDYAMNQDGTKCLHTVDGNKYCEDGWKLVNNDCVNPNSPNPKGTRTCPEKTYGGWTGTGTYYEAGRGYCGYYELHSYIGQRDNCRNNGGTLAANNHCYKYVELNYTITCAPNEKKFGDQEIAPGNGGGCYQVSNSKVKCPDGYQAGEQFGKCEKYIDPIYE